MFSFYHVFRHLSIEITIEDKLLPLKEELLNFAVELKKWRK